jgi:XTP/dITP diphosphohydrolase
MKKLIIASNNAGKVREFKALLKPLGYDVVSQSEAGINLSVAETGDTFEANARLKAVAIFEMGGQPPCPANFAVLSDDSGLCVDALGGKPGVYSADYNTVWLLESMMDVPANERTARFVCCIHYLDEQREIVVRGECEGRIGVEERGAGGFGYDSVFIPTGYERTFAELTADEKNAVSHRGIALRKLASELAEALS